jgi:hypothetical protein
MLRGVEIDLLEMAQNTQQQTKTTEVAESSKKCTHKFQKLKNK